MTTTAHRRLLSAELPGNLFQLRGWASDRVEQYPHRVDMDIDGVVWSMTELVTNAFRHGSAPVDIVLAQDPNYLLVSVSDSSESSSRPRPMRTVGGG